MSGRLEAHETFMGHPWRSMGADGRPRETTRDARTPTETYGIQQKIHGRQRVTHRSPWEFTGDPESPMESQARPMDAHVSPMGTHSHTGDQWKLMSVVHRCQRGPMSVHGCQ